LAGPLLRLRRHLTAIMAIPPITATRVTMLMGIPLITAITVTDRATPPPAFG